MTPQESADKIIFDAMHREPMLRVVCGWCGVVIRGGPPRPISHGMCKACSARMNAELDNRKQSL